MNTKLSTFLALILIPALPARSEDQTIGGNLTVTQGLFIQQDTNLYEATTFGHLVENPQMEGFRISTQQDSSTSTYTNVVSPGYWAYRDVIVEDYGMVDNGYWSPTYDWVTVADYFPATFDADGNMLTQESWGSHQEWQQVGSIWLSNLVWGVSGTHTQQEDYWVPEQVETVELTHFGAPRILLTATRSDTNWVFQTPSSLNGMMRDVLTIYNGGINMNSEDGMNILSVNPSQISQSSNQPDNHAIYHSTRGAETTSLRSYSSWQAGGSTMQAQTENVSRPESIRMTRVEYASSGAGTTAQTQIAAKSAQFGGVVTVEGDLKVKGALRVMPAGDLSMGAYMAGPTPGGN